MGDVFFDLQDPDFWLLKYSSMPLEALMGYSFILGAVALDVFIFGPLVPHIDLGGGFDLGALGAVVFWGLITLAIVYAGLLGIRSVDPRVLRLTDRGLVVSVFSFKGNRYETVPYSRLRDITITSGRSNQDTLNIVYEDDEGLTKEAWVYEPGREIDILGMVETLEGMLPEGPQPGVEEFLTQLEDAPDSNEVTKSRQWRSRRHGKNLMTMGVMYMALFGLLLMGIALYEWGVDAHAVSATVSAVLMYASASLVIIATLSEMSNPLLDAIERDLAIKGGEVLVPRPLASRLPFAIRRSMPLDEIREARPHLVLAPHSLATLLVDMRGRGFIAPRRVFERLDREPRFLREGWKLVNRNPVPTDGGPVARWDWWRVRLFLMLPALLFIIVSLLVYLR